MSLVWMQGAGEQASGVAWRLVRAGYRVVAAERPRPTTVRRLVSFSEAVHMGRCEVEGVVGELREPGDLATEARAVTVIVDPEAASLAGYEPDAVIDARLTKREPDPLPEYRCPTIGLGPGFVAGRHVDRVIETHRSARLGSVIARGGAAPATGIPGVVGGESLRRVLRAPCGGRLESRRELGDLVVQGETIALVAGVPLVAPFDGRLRGLIHPDVELHEGMKVGDVDPRGEGIDPYGISDKALAIGGGVLEALLGLGVMPDPAGSR